MNQSGIVFPYTHKGSVPLLLFLASAKDRRAQLAGLASLPIQTALSIMEYQFHCVAAQYSHDLQHRHALKLFSGK